jgi:hypothetical protein
VTAKDLRGGPLGTILYVENNKVNSIINSTDKDDVYIKINEVCKLAVDMAQSYCLLSDAVLWLGI